MDLAVAGAGRLTDYDFRRHVVRSEAGTCRLNLSGARFIDPFGLVMVATLAEQAIRRGLDVVFTPPYDLDCCRYMHRMGLAEILGELGVAHRLKPVRRHPTGDRLLVLGRFDADVDAADELAAQVHRIFEDQDERRAETLYDAVNEIAQNVVDHSDSTGAYVALQQFERTSEVSFAVADCGVGLRSSLRTNMTVRDDAHAIGLAVRRHVTSTGEEGRGVGLHSFVRHTRRSGRVQLLSGTHSGSFTRGRTAPALVRHPASFPGTVAQARLGLH